eukprot:g17246.t3
MSPKRNSARAKAAGAISGQRSKERVEKRAEKRPRAELIPRDSVRAIMHTFHVLTSRKDKPGGKGTRSRRKGAPSPKDDLNLLGCDVDTVMKAVDELEAGNLRRNPRQGRRRAMPRQKRGVRLAADSVRIRREDEEDQMEPDSRMEVEHKAPKGGKALLAKVAANSSSSSSGRGRGGGGTALTRAGYGDGGGSLSSFSMRGGDIGGDGAGAASKASARVTATGTGRGGARLEGAEKEGLFRTVAAAEASPLAKTKIKGKGGGCLLHIKSSSPKGSSRGLSAAAATATAGTTSEAGSERGVVAAARGATMVMARRRRRAQPPPRSRPAMRTARARSSALLPKGPGSFAAASPSPAGASFCLRMSRDRRDASAAAASGGNAACGEKGRGGGTAAGSGGNAACGEKGREGGTAAGRGGRGRVARAAASAVGSSASFLKTVCKREA